MMFDAAYKLNTVQPGSASESIGQRRDPPSDHYRTADMFPLKSKHTICNVAGGVELRPIKRI